MPIIVTTIRTDFATSATQGGVTFSFDGSYQTGNYADGPAWVVAPSGLSVTGITPAQTTLGGLIINAAMKNFAYGSNPAFDERTAGTFGTPLSLPAALATNDVVIKAVANTTGGITAGNASSTRRGLCDEFAALFVVSSAPAANSFSPAAVSWPGKTTLTSRVVDVSAFVSALPSYNTTGQTVAPYGEIISHIGRYAPVGITTNNTLVYQEFLPHEFGETNNYGQFVNNWINQACLALISDGYTTGQKEAIATHLISHGIQWGDVLDNVAALIPDGGHFQFHLGPIACAKQATGRSMTSLVADVGINFAGAFQFDASLLARLTPHTTDGEPFTWRERTIADTVSGLTVPILCTQSLARDPTQVDFRSLRLRRKSDGATALVTASASRSSGGTLIGSNTTTIVDLTIDAQPTPAFANGETVYFETPWAITEGDYEWAIAGTTQFNFYNPSPEAVYRATNNWTGQALLIKAAGWSGDFGAALGYVNRCNAANDPAGDDFPTHHRTTWEGQFWAQHAATIYT